MLGFGEFNDHQLLSAKNRRYCGHIEMYDSKVGVEGHQFRKVDPLHLSAFFCGINYPIDWIRVVLTLFCLTLD